MTSQYVSHVSDQANNAYSQFRHRSRLKSFNMDLKGIGSPKNLKKSAFGINSSINFDSGVRKGHALNGTHFTCTLMSDVKNALELFYIVFLPKSEC